MRKIILILFCFLVVLCTMEAQKIERMKFTNYLSQIEALHSIRFSYSPELVEEIIVPWNADNNLTRTLAFLEKNTAFQFEFADSTHVLISVKEDNKNMLVTGMIKGQDNDFIPGALIRIVNQKLATISDENGMFKMSCHYNTTDSLLIKYIGYKDQKVALKQCNENGTLHLVLKESNSNINLVTVTTYTTAGVLYNYKDHSIEIKPEMAGLLPGQTETDIYNSLQYLPGINSPNGKAGNLTIRGTDPDKTLITFDNIPIYHDGHYFGTFSPFNAQVIDKVKIQRNGSHGAERGGRVGGMIEISSKNDLLDTAKYNVGMATSFLTGNVQVPIIKNKLGIMVGGRTSYPIDWRSPKIESINNFIYQETGIGNSFLGIPDFQLNSHQFAFNDLNAKVIYQPHKKHDVSLSFLTINNKLDYNLLFVPRNEYSLDSVALNNWGANLSLNSKWSKKLTTTTSFTSSYYYQKLSSTKSRTITSDEAIENSSYINQTGDFKMKSNAALTLTKNSSIDIGYQLDYRKLVSTVSSFKAPSPVQSVNIPDESYLHSTYINYKTLNVKKFYGLTLGLRSSYYTPTNKIYLEPRILANIFVNDAVTLKTVIGVHNQFINQIKGVRLSPIAGIGNSLWRISNNEDISVVTGRQLLLGGIYSKNNWVLDIEGYYKLVDNVTAYNFLGPAAINKNLIYGSYENIGLDLLLKKEYKQFEGWLSYSYSNSNALFDTVAFPYLWNQKHVFSAVANYKWKNLKFSAGWHYKTGLAVAPDIRIRYFSGAPLVGNTSGMPPNPNPNPLNFTADSPEEYLGYFPDNHQLDVSVAYEVRPKSNKWNLNFGAAIQNVYNNRAVYAQETRRLGPQNPPNTAVRTHKYGLGFTPNLMIKFSW